jgi:hypothetical protein
VRWVALLLLLVNVALAAWIAAGAPGGPEATRAPPVEMGELTLLRESTDGSEAAPGRQAGACYTVGPFQNAERAEQARARLAELGLEPRQRTTTDEEVYGYQVLLPPHENRQAALAKTRELADKGIKDYFVIVSEPELRNAVSLGLFREKRYAVRHTEYLERLGFDPEMRLRTRTRTRYWQDYRDPRGRVTPELLESLAADQPLQRLERPCE